MRVDLKDMKQRQIGGLAGWILARIRRRPASAARLILHERITVGPRQHLALVEADGRRFLIATGADGAPAFLSLDPNWLGRKNSRRRASW